MSRPPAPALSLVAIPSIRFASCVHQRSTWFWVWPGWSGGTDGAFADSRCQCKRRKDLRHCDLTALALGYAGGRVGKR